jgi:hypothetical protein
MAQNAVEAEGVSVMGHTSASSRALTKKIPGLRLRLTKYAAELSSWVTLSQRYPRHLFQNLAHLRRRGYDMRLS